MGDSPLQELLRAIPSVDRLLADSSLEPVKARYSETLIKEMVRRALDELRGEIRAGTAGAEDSAFEAVAERVARLLEEGVGAKLKTVINATGVIIHTNLGRSPLSRRVTERISRAAMSYSNLEYNLDAGARGERNSHLRSLMEELTGAGAALAVNNNAAAVLLALNTLAAGREVIVSRGELIEIGGSFRIPDVMARSGAVLREVGTTNRTHPKDYRSAITEETALILKVHPSNYRIEGFTREVELDEIVALGKETGIPTMMDLGSGCFVDLSAFGLEGETTVQQVIAKGVDLVTFSGDKLLGGPQAGLAVGRAELVEKMRANPLARALRMDKLTLAGLEATLEEYTRADGPFEGIPTLAMIAATGESLGETAETMARELESLLGNEAEVSIESGVGRVGGGALPLGDLPGPRVAVRPRHISTARLARRLRTGHPPLITIVKEDAILIDPRTLLHDQARLVPRVLAAAFDVSEP